MNLTYAERIRPPPRSTPARHEPPRIRTQVTAKVVLQDPASGQVLAEGEGVFYAKKPPAPPQRSVEPASPSHRVDRAAPSSSPDGLRGKMAGGRTAAAPGGPLPPPPPPPPPPLPRTRPGGYERRRPKMKPLQQAGTKSYDDALRDFGRGNPNAAANLVDFHTGGSGGGDDASVLRTSKL